MRSEGEVFFWVKIGRREGCWHNRLRDCVSKNDLLQIVWWRGEKEEGTEQERDYENRDGEFQNLSINQQCRSKANKASIDMIFLVQRFRFKSDSIQFSKHNLTTQMRWERFLSVPPSFNLFQDLQVHDLKSLVSWQLGHYQQTSNSRTYFVSIHFTQEKVEISKHSERSMRNVSPKNR